MGFVVLLTLVVVGPLVGRGTLLLLDSAPGPEPRLSPSIWGFPPGPVNAAPVEAFFVWLYGLVPWGSVRLLPFAAAPALVAWGFSRLFEGRATAVVPATLLFVVNPFTYERMVAGHTLFVLGMALLPLLVALLVSERRSSAIAAGIVVALTVALSLHFAFITGLIVVSVVAVSLVTRRRLLAVSTAVSALVAGLLSLYWLVPALFAPAGPRSLSPVNVPAFRTRPDDGLGLVPNVLGLYGFWRREWPLPKDYLPVWPLLLAAILLVAAVGFWYLATSARTGMALGLVVAATAGVVLSLGDRGPVPFVWLFEHVPGFSVMREPQKFLALLVLAYAVCFGWGVKVLAERVGSGAGRTTVVAVLLLVPVVYGFRELWGFAGYARPTRYPVSWVQADRLMGEGMGKIWALPWHLYVRVPWAQNRMAANPMPSFFRRTVVSSTDAEYAAIGRGTASDETQEYLDSVIRSSSHVGRRIAPLGIEYVVLAKVADHRSYGWIYKQDDLRVVREWDDLVLLANEAAPTTQAHAGDRPVRLARSSAVDYAILDRMADGPLTTTLTPGSGWEYEGTRSRPGRAGTAVFDVNEVVPGSVRYAPWRVVQLSYAFGALTLLIVVVVFVGLRAHERKLVAA